MPDRKLKTKRDEREKVKLKEQGKLEDAATKNEGFKRTDTGSQDASLRKQLDLFHFYKKKVYGPGSHNDRTHTTEIVRAETDIQASVNAYINSTVDETLSNGDGFGMGPSLVKTVIDNDMASFNTQSDTRASLIIPSNVMLNESANALSKTSNANASDTVMTQRGMDWSTDVNSTIKEQHNTSTVYSNTSSEPKDQDIPTQCAASSQLSPLSSHTPQLSHSTFPLDGPALTPHLSQSNIFLTTDPVSFSGHEMPSLIMITNQLNGRKDITNAEDTSNKGEIRCGSSRNPDIESSPNFWEEATLEDSDSHYCTAMVKPLLSSASSAPTPGAKQVIEQASEHEGEKEFKRRDHLKAEEASESICTALQNVNGNGPGAEDIDAINRSIPTPDRLSEEGKSITIPICLTASPRPELGPPAGIATPPLNRHEFISFSQGNPFPNEICTNEAATAANHGKFSSPASGSREKPIEVLSPVSLAQLESPSRAHFWSSSSKVLRKSGQNTYQIHPFFQRTTKATMPVPTINPNRGTDGDSVGLDLNFKLASFSGHSSQNSGTTKHATFRAHIPKGKRNKDKLGDEAQCDITNESGNEDADVIFSRLTGEKKQNRDTNDISLTTSVLVPLRVLAPWPNSENQHVMKSQRLAVKPAAFRERIRKVKKVDETKVEGSLIERLNCKYMSSKQEASLVQPLSQMTSSSTVRPALATIPNEHGKHPGIARVISVIEDRRREGRMEENAETLPLHSTWTTKWKPRRAAEVLGNESQALYLREWLKALSIRDRKCSTTEKAKDKEKENIKIKKHKRKRKEEEQGQVRRVVIRSIAKRKRRRIESDEDNDGDKSWIVSDEGEEIYGKVSGDWLSDAGKPQENDLSNDQEILEKEFSKRLTNTIVIAGKPGTGKTSAVYACAVELGWEIFEVYPGIGKRAGANVVELVGNVGKNHIVGKGVRQSIILLEEVDILFKEDVNFWTSVVNIISTSHRPVILTCNDASLIPQDLLPLQTCLKFEACPCGLASSFLQAVCIAEGFDVTRKRVEEEYALIGGDEPEWPPSVAFPSEALPSADLRSALNRLQMGLRFPASQEEFSGNCIQWTVEEHALKDCELYAETASYVDAYLNPIKQKPEFETQGDDEIGYTMLTKLEECPFKDMQKTDFNNYSMACDALAYCRHVVNVSSTKCEDTQPQSASEPASESEHRWLIQTRRLLARQAASFLDEIISLPGPLLPRHEAVLEYVPTVRWLVSLDDAQDQPSHSRRRWRHVRYMALSEQALSAAREYYDMFFPRCIT